MASEAEANAPPSTNQRKLPETKRQRSIFDLPVDFFDSSRILPSPTSSSLPFTEPFETLSINDVDEEPKNDDQFSMQRWSCNTCKAEFDSLLDQRSHFKSDIHRFNIKLTIAGKNTIKEEDLDETTLCKDYDISSISGSEDEDDKKRIHDLQRGFGKSDKSKLFVQLQTGERVSLWKCLLLDESENVLYDNDKFFNKDDGDNHFTEREITEKLKNVIHESRDKTNLRVVLLLRGGHFAGCVFDGNSVVAHKTFHRYVVRAKAGKQQSTKDASSGRTIHSAGAALRRYNEFALKKDIQELLATWKPYFASASSIFIYAPLNNRQMFFDGEKPYTLRNIPLTVRRPTFKEAQRIYNILTQISYNIDDEIETITPIIKETSSVTQSVTQTIQKIELSEDIKDCLEVKILESDNVITSTSKSTPLHEAAKSGNIEKVVQLLEEGLDPCVIDERSQTPYMLATEKEVRNAFRRFMALNLDKWDWVAAKVPSALTKEMEESQATKQAEKDAKRKARAKELKKLRKAKEKKAQVEAAKLASQSSGVTKLTKEEEIKKSQEDEREKRAAAAERRLAAMASVKDEGNANNTELKKSDTLCSCCNASLIGVIPFHRYNYKYCSSTCMHVHKDILEEEDE